jgi:hypothetical protein
MQPLILLVRLLELVLELCRLLSNIYDREKALKWFVSFLCHIYRQYVLVVGHLL